MLRATTAAFNTFSSSVNHEIINGDYGNTTSGQVGTGAKQLALPFVTGTQHDYELIRRPPDQYLTAAGVTDSAALSQSREYNLAQIHVLVERRSQRFAGRGFGFAKRPAGEPDGRASTGASGKYDRCRNAVSVWSADHIEQLQHLDVGDAVERQHLHNVFCLRLECGSYSVDLLGNDLYWADWPYAPFPFSGQSASQGLQPSNPHPTASGAVNAPAYLANDTSGFNYSGGTAATPPTIPICPPTSPAPATVPAGCPAAGEAYPYYALPNPSTPVVSSALTPYNSAYANSWSLIDGYSASGVCRQFRGLAPCDPGMAAIGICARRDASDFSGNQPDYTERDSAPATARGPRHQHALDQRDSHRTNVSERSVGGFASERSNLHRNERR